MIVPVIVGASTLLGAGWAFDKWSKGTLWNPAEKKKPENPTDWLLITMGVVSAILLGVVTWLLLGKGENHNRDFQLAFLGIDPATLGDKSDAYIAGLVKKAYFDRKQAKQTMETPLQVAGLKAKRINVTLGEDYAENFKKY